MELKRFCGRVWILERNFQIQERPNNIFIISFDLIKDRNKVLRGGLWWYQQVPIVIQLYDGVKSIKNLAMDSLFFWVRIQNIPPTYEILENFLGIASVAGRYIGYDDKLFMRSKMTSPEYELKGDLTVGEGRKRGRPSSPETSPKKLKVLIDLLQAHEAHVHTKRLKQLDFLAAFSAKTLGLTSDSTELALVPTEAQKKKKRLPISSKNRKPRRSANQEDMTPSTPPAAPPSPSVKGKEVL
ncbi:hypothetical protein ACLB2K_001799 [Fragaria x ananassa]